MLIDYTAKIKETGEIFDTTMEDLAKNERLYKEGEIYEPKLIVIGEGWVLKALDENLHSLKINKTEAIEISPDKAFGPRDPEKLKRVSLRRLREKGITPKLGMRIEYEKRLATIRTMGGGRVLLDFNPPLAGKTLIYEVTAKKKLRTRREKVLALIHRRIPIAEISNFKLDMEKADATIHVPEEAFYIEGLQVAKRGIAADLQRFFPSIARVEFIETFQKPETETKKPETKTEKPEAKPAKSTAKKRQKAKRARKSNKRAH